MAVTQCSERGMWYNCGNGVRLLCFLLSLQGVEGHSDPGEKGRECGLLSCFANRMAKEECCFVFCVQVSCLCSLPFFWCFGWKENFFFLLGVLVCSWSLVNAIFSTVLITFLLPWQTPQPSQIIEESHLIWVSRSQRVRDHDHNSWNLAVHRQAWH